MRQRRWQLAGIAFLLALMLCAVGYAARARTKRKPAAAPKAGESERKVTEAEVPKAALAMLKRLARGAKITEFAEEIEHGSTFYEGSWKSRSGSNMDVLVTAAGALVEIEEQIKTDKVPAAVLKAVRKAAGKQVDIACERKTMILYEIKFRKGDGLCELLLTPDGRVVEKEVEKGKSEDRHHGKKAVDDDDDDDDDEHHGKKAVDDDDDEDDDDDDDDR